MDRLYVVRKGEVIADRRTRATIERWPRPRRADRVRDVALSPDGTRAVASRTNPLDTTKADLWLFDLTRGSGATRLTLGATSPSSRSGLQTARALSSRSTRACFGKSSPAARGTMKSCCDRTAPQSSRRTAGRLTDGFSLTPSPSHRPRDPRVSISECFQATSESPFRSYATLVDSTRSRLGFRQWGDGSPSLESVRRAGGVRLRVTSDFSSGSASREKACWCPAAAAVHHAGVVMAASSFISHRAGS